MYFVRTNPLFDISCTSTRNDTNGKGIVFGRSYVDALEDKRPFRKLQIYDFRSRLQWCSRVRICCVVPLLGCYRFYMYFINVLWPLLLEFIENHFCACIFILLRIWVKTRDFRSGLLWFSLLSGLAWFLGFPWNNDHLIYLYVAHNKILSRCSTLCVCVCRSRWRS